MDNRFIKEDGLAAFTGNELILKGALEGGVALVTGYPGSPVSEVFDAVNNVSSLLLEKGIVAQMANNEGLAAARLNGARLAALRGMAIMKSVGMHVAADGLAIGNLTEPRLPDGGAMVVVGDDPWNETTQINSDSRFLSQHLHMPILEPTTFQEIKDWIKEGFELSGEADLYLTYVLTTNQADGGGTVRCRPNLYPVVNHHQRTVMSSAQMPVDRTVMIPPHTSMREATLAARFGRLVDSVRRRGLNRVEGPEGRHTVGFMSAGLSYAYMVQALQEMGLENRFPVLKWGVSFPLDEELLIEFAARVDHIVVVEEKRGFLETQAIRAIKHAHQAGKLSRLPAIWGKTFPDDLPGFPVERGLNVAVVIERLAPLLQTAMAQSAVGAAAPRVAEALALGAATGQYRVNIPVRTPTFCPGCPHRDSSTVTKSIKADFQKEAYMRKKHDRAPLEVIFHGESGCHSMLQFEPNIGLMQDYSGMGLGGGTGAGMDPFIKNKQVVFLGDSTFFHSGVLAVSDSIKNNQDITYIILENKTTAMTGHQPTPGVAEDLMSQETFAQDIEQVIRGMARDTIPIHRVNPAYRESYRELLEEVILQPGVKVVIADKECGITYHRRVRKERKRVMKSQGYIPEERVINITPEVCEFCLECTNATGCPGLAIEDTLHGPKIVTDKSLCISDGACAKGKVCPSFEEVVIRRRQPAAALPGEAAAALAPVETKKVKDLWFCYTAGVGGMGSGLVTGILVQAGMLEGYRVVFADKKGLAIRNGGVYGHVIYSTSDRVLAPLVPYGRADFLLGIDLLEAVRGLDPKVNLRVASPDRTAAVVNTHKMPTVKTLLGKDDFSIDELEKTMRSYTKPGAYLGLDFSNISEAYFGTKLYANVLLLGAAYQKGFLPVSLDNLKRALAMMVPPSDLNENIRAFELGRQAAAGPGKFAAYSPKLPDYWEVLEDRAQLLKASHPVMGGRWSREYRKITEDALRWMDMDDAPRPRLAQYVYDLFQFAGPAYARRYLSRLWSVYQKDSKTRGHAATRAVLDNLYRAMVIKDEVYVAGLLTSEEKLRRDRARFNVDPSRGDSLEYIHLNRPNFTFLGRQWQFDFRARNWQLAIMKRLGVLRRFLSQWHAREKEFRDWYEARVDEFQLYTDDETYRLHEELLRLPSAVKGYREIRYPKMDAARARAEELLAQIRGRRGGGSSRRSPAPR